MSLRLEHVRPQRPHNAEFLTRPITGRPPSDRAAGP